MKSLNLGPSLDPHDHEGDDHAGHDHRGVRLGPKSRRDRRSADERNTTWDQVCKKIKDGRLRFGRRLGSNGRFPSCRPALLLGRGADPDPRAGGQRLL